MLDNLLSKKPDAFYLYLPRVQDIRGSIVNTPKTSHEPKKKARFILFMQTFHMHKIIQIKF